MPRPSVGKGEIAAFQVYIKDKQPGNRRGRKPGPRNCRGLLSSEPGAGPGSGQGATLLERCGVRGPGPKKALIKSPQMRPNDLQPKVHNQQRPLRRVDPLLQISLVQGIGFVSFVSRPF